MKCLVEESVHEDERRRITQLFTANIKQVNVYDAKKGSVLGNHYHKETDEYFYIVRGTVMYNESRIFETGDLFVVYPQEMHTISCLTDTKFMTFLSRPYKEDDKDIWKN